MEEKEKRDTNEKIAEYKTIMERMFVVRDYNMVEKAKESIQGFLDIDLRAHKITEEEYDILEEYLLSITKSHYDKLSQKEENEKERK